MDSFVADLLRHVGSNVYPPAPEDDPTYIVIKFPHLFQREDEQILRDPLFQEQKWEEITKECLSSNRSEIDVLFALFQDERTFLTDWLLIQVRNEVESIFS